MKSIHPEVTQRYLVLIKLDAAALFKRIDERKEEYIEVFSLKRNRSVFKEIFENRFQKANMSDLSNLPTEVIQISNDFYQMVDELYWYLKHTQDMPNMIKDEVTRRVARLSKHNDNLQLYINAELSGEDLFNEIEAETEIPALDAHNDYFLSEGELSSIDGESDFIQDENYTFDEGEDEEAGDDA